MITLSDEQREVLEPVLAIVRALPSAERPQLIEALVAQFVAVFREDRPACDEDDVQRYGNMVRESLMLYEGNASPSQTKVV